MTFPMNPIVDTSILEILRVEGTLGMKEFLKGAYSLSIFMLLLLLTLMTMVIRREESKEAEKLPFIHHVCLSLSAPFLVEAL